MKKEFNQKKYNMEYNKKHYKTFKVDLKISELEELNEILKLINVSKADFLRNSIKELKEKYKKKE